MSTIGLLCSASAIILCGILFCIVKRKNANPKTSFLMATINIFLHPLRVLQIGMLKDSVTLDKAMKDAMSATNLHDYRDLHFVDNYKHISELPFYKSLKFSNLGLIMAKMEMQMGLCTRRLLMVDYFKKHPCIESIPVQSPLFVIGIGRSGTTFLHRLLSLDTAVRSPYLWEMMCPTPRVHEEYSAGASEIFATDRVKRAADARQQVAGLNSLGDKTMENIHEVNSDLPEECIVAMSDEIPLSFHFLYSSFTNMTEFCKEIPSARIIAAYQSYKRILQLLSYQVGEGVAGEAVGRRWVLKSPVHSFFLKELLQVFPDAKFVWPHRNPERCLSSHCSLVRGLHLMYYERESLFPTQLGQAMLRENQHMLTKSMATMDDSSQDCAHIMYDALVSNPIDTVQQIYTQFNWKYTAEYDAKLKAFLLEDNARRAAVKKTLNQSIDGQQTLNEHSLTDFGLCVDDLNTEVFKKYKKRFELDSLKY